MTNVNNNQQIYTKEFFEDCLLRGGWKTVPLEEDLYLINYEGQVGAFTIYGKFIPEKYLVTFSGVYSYPIPSEKISVALEYINYTNYGVPFGNLELNESTNEVCFRTSLMFFNIELTGQLLNNLVHDCIKAMEHYTPGIPLIVESNLNVQEAYAATMSKS